MTVSRRGALAALSAGLAAPTLAAPAVARQEKAEVRRWRMVTSWPKNLPGPGVSAQRLADRITAMSGGRIHVTVFAAGELVPPLEVFDAVANGTAQIAHTAALFWAGKFEAASFFTAAPFGLTPLEHMTWIIHGGGQALWDDLYAGSGVKPFMAGNTGFQMGGWFRREIASIADLQGLKMRIPGLGGRVLEKFGAVPVVLAPGEIFPALQSGLIDATEFLGPFSDHAMGFHKVAPFYYYPGWHEPNGTGEALVSSEAWQELAPDLQSIIATACAEVNVHGLTDSEWANAETLNTLMREKGTALRSFPAEVTDAMRAASEEVMDEMAKGDDLTARIVASYRNAARHQKSWSDVSVRAFLQARS
jgi:TRAP-type mannitol/chloroaromatic compound transport system substrate-binding protein